MNLKELCTLLKANQKVADKTRLLLPELLKGVPLGADIVGVLEDVLQRAELLLGKVELECGEQSVSVILTKPMGLDAVLRLSFTSAKKKLAVVVSLLSTDGIDLLGLGRVLLAVTGSQHPLQLPGGLDAWPSLGLKKLQLDFAQGDTGPQQLSLVVINQSPWLPPALVELSLTDAELDLSLSYPSNPEQRKLSGKVSADWAVASVGRIGLMADLEDKQLQLKGDGKDLDLVALAALFRMDLPQQLGELKGTVSLSARPGKGDFCFSAEVAVSLQLADQALQGRLKYQYVRASDKSWSSCFNLAKQDSDAFTLIHGLDLCALELKGDYHSGGGAQGEVINEVGERSWKLEGSGALDINGTALQLALGLSNGGFQISGKTGEDSVVKLPGGLGTLDHFDVDLNLPTKGKPGGRLDAMLALPGVDGLMVCGKLQQRLLLQVKVAQGDANLLAFLTALGMTPPAELPLLEATGGFMVKYQSPYQKVPAEFAVSGQLQVRWALGQAILPSECCFHFERKAEGRAITNTGQLSITVLGEGSELALTDFMSVTGGALTVRYAKKVWKGDGKLTTRVLDKHFGLDAELKHDAAKNSFTLLTTDDSKQLALPIPGVQGAFLKTLDFNLSVLRKDKHTEISGGLGCALALPGVKQIGLQGKFGKQLELTIEAEQVSLQGISKGLGASLPEELPEVRFSINGCVARDASKRWLFDLKITEASLDWQLGSNALKATANGHLTRSIDAEGRAKLNAGLVVHGKGEIELIPDLSLSALSLDFKHEKDNWCVDGGLELGLLDARFTLQAAYKGANGKRKLSLVTTKASADQKVALPGIDKRNAALTDFDFQIQLLREADKTTYSGFLTVALSGRAFGEQTRFQASLDKDLCLLAKAEDLALADMASAVGIELPDTLPKLSGNYDLKLQRVKKAKAWTFQFKAGLVADWPVAQGSFKTNATIDLKRSLSQGAAIYSGSLDFSAKGDQRLLEGLEFNGFALTVSKTKKANWMASGKGKLTVLDRRVDYTASYKQSTVKDTKQQSLVFSVVASGELINVGDATLTAAGLSLSVSRKGKLTEWQLDAGASLEVVTLKPMKGVLSLAKSDQKMVLSFTPKNIEINIPVIPEPKALRTVFVITPGALKLQKEASDWCFSGAFNTRMSVLPKDAAKVLPTPLKKQLKKGINTTLAANQQGVSVSIDRIIAPITIPADIPLPDGTLLRLGTAALDSGNFTLRLGKKTGISADFGFALPSRLNDIFGTQNGQPVANIFNVYDPQHTGKGYTTGRVSLDSKTGISVRLESSPIRALEVKNGIWKATLGEDGRYGEFQIELPSIAFNGLAFTASGGFDITKPLAIPLIPLKQFINNIGLPDVAKGLPDKLPLPTDSLSLIERHSDDPSKWRLKTAELMKLLGAILPLAELQALSDALDIVSDKLNLLPERLLEYMDVRIPDGLHANLTLTPDGGANFAVEAKGAPIRMLMPQLYPPMLNGVTLRQASFGEVLGGSLFLLRLSIEFDQFDLISLAASIALQELNIPVSKDFHRRLIVDDLYCFIIYQTGIPIPIPVFYKELGVELLGIEGIGAQAHIHFPLPSPNLGDIAKAAASLYKFFSDPKARLPVRDAPPIMPIFSLSDCYLQLPEYLGGEFMGLKGELSLDSNKVFASFMNGVKFMEPGDLITLLPLNQRANQVNESIKINNFAAINMQAKWLLSTPEEFIDQAAYQRLGLKTREQAERMLAVAPGSISPNSTGLIVFLMGRWDAALIGTGFDVRFALVAENSRQFATGFLMQGRLLDMFEARLAGQVSINPKRTPAFQLQGAGMTRLHLLGLDVFKGAVNVIADSKQFSLKGEFSLLDKQQAVYACGRVDGYLGDNSFDLSGQLEAHLLFLTSKANLAISSAGMRLDVEHLGRILHFGVTTRNNQVVINGKLPVLLSDYEAEFRIQPEPLSIGVTLDSELFNAVKTHLRLDIKGGQQSAFNGRATLEALSNQLFTGSVIVSAEKFDLQGKLRLLPENFPVNVRSDDVHAIINSKALDFNGGISAEIGPIRLDGNTRLTIDPQGFNLRSTWLRQDLNVMLRDEGNYLKGHFSNRFGPLQSRYTISINQANGQTDVSMQIAAGDLQFKAQFKGSNTSGSYQLNIGPVQLVSGSIQVGSDGFALSGQLNLGPLQASVSGSISPQRGLSLSGNINVDITIAGVSGGVRIGNQGVSVNGTAWAGYGVVKIEGSASGGIVSYRGQVSTLLHFHTYVWPVHINAYICIPAKSPPWVAFDKPHDWPALGGVQRLAAFAMLKPEEPQALPSAQELLLTIQQSFMIPTNASSLAIAGKEPTELQQSASLWLALDHYAVQVFASGGPLTGGLGFVLHAERDSNPLFDELVQAMQQHPEIGAFDTRHATLSIEAKATAHAALLYILELKQDGQTIRFTACSEATDIKGIAADMVKQ